MSIRSCTCIAWLTVFVLGCAVCTFGQTGPLNLEDRPTVFAASSSVTKVADRSESSTTPTESSSDDSDTTDPTSIAKPANPEARASQRFQWKPALAQALLGTGIYHGWRFAHESGTRDALNGHWFQDWMASIGPAATRSA